MGPIDGGPEGEASTPDYVQGQLIVEFAPGTSAAARSQLLQQEDATLIQNYYGLDYSLIQLPASMASSDIGGVSDYWVSKPEITYAEPNYYLYSAR